MCDELFTIFQNVLFKYVCKNVEISLLNWKKPTSYSRLGLVSLRPHKDLINVQKKSFTRNYVKYNSRYKR